MSDTRYFLGLREDVQFVKDGEGKSFASQGEARAYAVQAMRDMLSEALRTGEHTDIQSIDIADEYGSVVDSVSQSDAVDGIIDIK